MSYLQQMTEEVRPSSMCWATLSGADARFTHSGYIVLKLSIYHFECGYDRLLDCPVDGFITAFMHGCMRFLKSGTVLACCSQYII
jgi:hypothetical protein